MKTKTTAFKTYELKETITSMCCNGDSIDNGAIVTPHGVVFAYAQSIGNPGFDHVKLSMVVRKTVFERRIPKYHPPEKLPELANRFAAECAAKKIED